MKVMVPMHIHNIQLTSNENGIYDANKPQNKETPDVNVLVLER
jgi:hypothetical protein